MADLKESIKPIIFDEKTLAAIRAAQEEISPVVPTTGRQALQELLAKLANTEFQTDPSYLYNIDLVGLDAHPFGRQLNELLIYLTQSAKDSITDQEILVQLQKIVAPLLATSPADVQRAVSLESHRHLFILNYSPLEFLYQSVGTDSLYTFQVRHNKNQQGSDDVKICILVKQPQLTFGPDQHNLEIKIERPIGNSAALQAIFEEIGLGCLLDFPGIEMNQPKVTFELSASDPKTTEVLAYLDAALIPIVESFDENQVEAGSWKEPNVHVKKITASLAISSSKRKNPAKIDDLVIKRVEPLLEKILVDYSSTLKLEEQKEESEEEAMETFQRILADPASVYFIVSSLLAIGSIVGGGVVTFQEYQDETLSTAEGIIYTSLILAAANGWFYTIREMGSRKNSQISNQK